jgi:DNA modification methylase
MAGQRKENKEAVVSFRIPQRVADTVTHWLGSKGSNESLNQYVRRVFLEAAEPRLRSGLFADAFTNEVPRSDVLIGDARHWLKLCRNDSIDCCVSSPPYYRQRRYGHCLEIGWEKAPQEYVHQLVNVFGEVKRILKPTGSLWLNLGDSYVNKRLLGIPWTVAQALQCDGWTLRSEVIWHKVSCAPEPVRDRPSRDHETFFLFTKGKDYFYDADAIRTPLSDWAKDCIQKSKLLNGIRRPRTNVFSKEQRQKTGQRGVTRAEFGLLMNEKGSNRRSVWPIQAGRYRGSHFATFPLQLVEPAVLAGCPTNGIVIDPFCGVGTTGVAALRLGRKFIGVELLEQFADIARRRLEIEIQAPVARCETPESVYKCNRQTPR